MNRVEIFPARTVEGGFATPTAWVRFLHSLTLWQKRFNCVFENPKVGALVSLFLRFVRNFV
jgi:hypothetical protein